MNKIFSALPTTIFEVMSVLAREKQAINLGQGFPDDPGPEDVRRRLQDFHEIGIDLFLFKFPPVVEEVGHDPLVVEVDLKIFTFKFIFT
jgi:hypothetical protein